MTQTKMRLLVAYGSTILLLTFSVFPLLWMFSTALKPLDEIFEYPPTLLPKQFTVTNFLRLFEESHFLTYLKNSITVATATVLLTLTVASALSFSWSPEDRRIDSSHIHVRSYHDHYSLLHPG